MGVMQRPLHFLYTGNKRDLFMSPQVTSRPHAVTYLPDVLLGLVGMFLFLEGRWLLFSNNPFMRDINEGLGVFFAGMGLIHFLCWMGFQVTITPSTVRIRRCWFFEKVIDRQRPDVRIVARPARGWDARLNKGTLVIYAHAGDVLTLEHLASFQAIRDFLQAHAPFAGPLEPSSPMRFQE